MKKQLRKKLDNALYSNQITKLMHEEASEFVDGVDFACDLDITELFIKMFFENTAGEKLGIWLDNLGTIHVWYRNLWCLYDSPQEVLDGLGEFYLCS